MLENIINQIDSHSDRHSYSAPLVREPLTLTRYIEEMNRRLPDHPQFRPGMRVVKDELAASTGGTGGYTFTWPPSADDDPQSFFDARNVVFDVELQMREHYVLEEMVDHVEPHAA